MKLKIAGYEYRVVVGKLPKEGESLSLTGEVPGGERTFVFSREAGPGRIKIERTKAATQRNLDAAIRSVMAGPVRVVLSRAKGWRMPANTVKVDRSTRWGNPFLVTEDRTPAQAVGAFEIWLTVDGVTAGLPEKKAAILEGLPLLRGKNLACWCKAGTACHAEVLLKLANREPEKGAGR